MENETQPNQDIDKLINSFCEITSSSKQEALFFLESYQWDLDAAVSTFLDDTLTATPVVPHSNVQPPPPSSSRQPLKDVAIPSPSPPPSQSPDYSPSESSPSRSRSRSPSPASRYGLRSQRAEGKQPKKPLTSKRSSRRARNVRTLPGLNPKAVSESDSESDDTEEYYTGDQKSETPVQDPKKFKDVDAIINKARQIGVEKPIEQPSSNDRNFVGTGRLSSGEVSAVSHSHTITFWSNGFAVDDGPFRRLDDPANASFLESISNAECPDELQRADGVPVCAEICRIQENYSERPKRQTAFQGTGRTLASSSSTSSTTTVTLLKSAPLPSTGLVVDDALPTTLIQLRLADGTRMVSRFNFHHTIRDICGFINASRPGGAKKYQLLNMGFPPKQLADLDQTIELAGIANSVVIQKL